MDKMYAQGLLAEGEKKIKALGADYMTRE